jgi:MipA family protein
MKKYVLPFSLLALISATTVAETQIEKIHGQHDGWVYGLGLAMLSEDEGYKGMDRELDPTPVLYAESERFRLMGLQAEYKVLMGQRWSVGAHLETRMDGFEKGDSDFLDGMAEREGTFYGGVNVRTEGDWGRFSTKLLKDIGNTHDGYRAAAEYRYPMPLVGGLFTPWLEVEYYGKDMMNYYYGVTTSEATAARTAYQPGASIHFDIGMDYQYQWGQHHSVLLSLKYRKFGSELKDSPIIEDSGSARLLVGYIYRF